MSQQNKPSKTRSGASRRWNLADTLVVLLIVLSLTALGTGIFLQKSADNTAVRYTVSWTSSDPIFSEAGILPQEGDALYLREDMMKIGTLAVEKSATDETTGAITLTGSVSGVFARSEKGSLILEEKHYLTPGDTVTVTTKSLTFTLTVTGIIEA